MTDDGQTPVDPDAAQDLTTQFSQILLGDVSYWIDHQTYAATEIGVRFHLRLVFIHLFVNGNGRHARLATSALARALDLGFDHFSWGARSGRPAEEARRRYLGALREADLGDYRALLSCAVD